jgi:hypothetical protein
MLSPRRSAQLGLGAACLMLVTSITVLVAGSAESNHSQNTAQTADQVSGESHVTPLATGQLATGQLATGQIGIQPDQRVATDKQ